MFINCRFSFLEFHCRFHRTVRITFLSSHDTRRHIACERSEGVLRYGWSSFGKLPIGRHRNEKHPYHSPLQHLESIVDIAHRGFRLIISVFSGSFIVAGIALFTRISDMTDVSSRILIRIPGQYRSRSRTRHTQPSQTTNDFDGRTCKLRQQSRELMDGYRRKRHDPSGV
jgi:hypothetical protein